MSDPEQPENEPGKDSPALDSEELGGDEEGLDEPLDILAGLRNVAAPPDLGDAVEERINKRSAGKFFSAPSLADRKPLAVVGVLVLLVVALLFWMLRDSSTGSIPSNQPDKPELAPGAENALPTP